MIGRLLFVSLMVSACFLFGRSVDALPGPPPPVCTWGASSVTVTVDKAGTVHQAAPVVTGCAP